MEYNVDDVKIPKYVLVKNSLLKKIETGEYPGQFKIPSENEISDIYSVSVITARKALSELTNEGFIYRVKGKGSFVNDRDSFKPAKNRAGLKSITLSVLMYENSDSSTMQIIRGTQAQLSKKGYSLVIECCHDNIDEEAQILDKCLKNNVDGVLLFSADPDANISSLKKLRANGIPFVLIDRGASQFPASLVSSYNIDGTYEITNFLIESGHRKIAYAAQNLQLATEQNRLSGYKIALGEADINVDDELCIDRVTDNLDRLYEMVLAHKPTAIVCVNDKCAVIVINYLKSKGINVPADISVTGFDDAEFGRYSTPALTTVRQTFDKIGEVAAEKLIELIENESARHSQIFLPVELVIRDSTAPNAKSV